MGLEQFETESKSIKFTEDSIKFTEDMKEPTEELGYIIGVILGDGGVYDSKKVKLKSKDKEFVEEFARVFCKWADLEWDGAGSEETDVSFYGPIEIKGNRKDQWSICKGIAPLYDFLNEYQEGNYDIEDMLLKNENFKIGLLRGLWDSEGSIRKTGDDLRFGTTDDKINLLYMKLVEDLIGVHLDLDGEWTTDKKASKKKGEFRVSTKGKRGSRDIAIPDMYINEFYNTVEPSIQRKVEIFEKRIDSDSIEDDFSSGLGSFIT